MLITPRYRVAICDHDGWREFAIALTVAQVAMISEGGPLMTRLRDEFGDRFDGHAMVIEPC